MIALRESLVLTFAVLVAFGLSLTAPFHLDDYSIFSDPALTSSSGWWQVWKPLETRPLTSFSFWLNHRFGGRDPLGYHAVNLALHLGCVLLLFDVLARVLPRRAAFLASLLFALHPIQTQAVVYVFARGILLATMFCLLSLRSWIRGRHWTATVWFAVALLAKEECSAFPLLLLLLHFSVSRNVREFRSIAVMMALSLAAGLRVMYAVAAVPGAGAGVQAGISPAEYLAAQGIVILRYVRLLVFPWGFTIDPDVGVPEAWVAVLAWLAIAGTAVLASHHFSRAREGFWWMGGLVLLLPSSSIFPAADLLADRRVYLPLVAFAAAAGLLLRKVRYRYLAPAGVVLVLLSFARTQVWQSERALWQEAADRSPRKLRPRIQLARASQPSEALRLLREAQRLFPESALVPAELGKTYMLLGRPEQALPEFGRALALEPRNAQALNNRGVALVGLGQRDAARQDFERALDINPCLFDARFNLARAGGSTPPPPDCSFSEDQLRLLQQP